MESSHHTKTIWTIGHSNLPVDEFIQMLHSFHIKILADIRSFPGSKYCPQYNKEQLQKIMNEEGIQYLHLVELGGRRKTTESSKNTGWKNAAFRGYADYMETGPFKKSIETLKKIAEKENLAYMCSEALWWRCHRSLVSDVFKHDGWEVMHIMGVGKASEHPYTSPARIIDGKLQYPPTENNLFSDSGLNV